MSAPFREDETGMVKKSLTTPRPLQLEKSQSPS